MGFSSTKNDRLESRLLRRDAEIRLQARTGHAPRLVGHAAVFDRLSDPLGEGGRQFREKIRPGAFARALAKADVRALYNHDSNFVLGRTRNGTLRLAEDSIGLRCEIDLPDTSAGRDVAESIRRGDVSGMSFAFTIADESWDTTSTPAVREIRQIRELFDVGPVTFPAYPNTSVALRSLERVRTMPPEAPWQRRARVRAEVQARMAELDAKVRAADGRALRRQAVALVDACLGRPAYRRDY